MAHYCFNFPVKFNPWPKDQVELWAERHFVLLYQQALRGHSVMSATKFRKQKGNPAGVWTEGLDVFLFFFFFLLHLYLTGSGEEDKEDHLKKTRKREDEAWSAVALIHPGFESCSFFSFPSHPKVLFLDHYLSCLAEGLQLISPNKLLLVDV